MGCSKGSSKRAAHSYAGPPQEGRKIPNTQLKSTPKETRKRTTQKP